MIQSIKSVHGLTLVEMMVSLAIGLVLIAAVGYAYLGSRAAYRQQEGLARMQEGARFAFEALTYDIRMAGFTGCRANTSVSVLNGANWYGNLYSQPLVGFETGAAPATIAGNVVAGDSLAVLRADNSAEYTIDSHNPTAAQFQLAANHDLKQGEILVATDCSHSVTFQMSNVNNNNTIDTVVHNTGAMVPGNCTKGFGQSAPGSGVPLCTANGVAYTFSPGSRIMRMSGNIYYIGNNGNGIPSLYRLRLNAAGGNVGATAEELVEGVEDMQITYGVDTSNPATCSDTDGVVDAYVDANAVPATAPCATAEDDWKKVLSVRISLLMRTEDGITSQPQPYFFTNPLAATVPADRRLRKVFTTTVAVRNRL